MKDKNNKTKYIFVTGGVLSGVGKGITAASIGAILKGKGLKVSMQKCDPYLNVDAGLLNPVEHGECFVTHDGVETDLDLGHYERFLDEETNKYSITLSGAIFKELIDKERAGGFRGKTVQLVPHFTDLVQEKIVHASEGSDVHIVEIGGTVGDYEGLSFVEAIRLFANKVGRRNCLYVSVVYAPWINTSKEVKTKPAQNALKDLRGFGIIPDVVCVRTEKPVGREICAKIAAFSGISAEAVINLPDISSVYDVPLNVLKSGVLDVLNEFVQDFSEPDMREWKELSERRAKKYAKTVRVGLVAKYVGNEDTYMCVTEALRAAAFENEVNLDLVWINAEKAVEADFAAVDGIVVPGGFGNRGVEGKIAAAGYALAHDKPYLGLCLGLQVAVVAAARRAGLVRANSEEFDEKTPENVIYIMEGQKGKESTGASMRLGDYPAQLVKGSQVAKIYGASAIIERHRHRYEVNRKFLPEIERGGIMVSGASPDGKLVEFIEAPECRFFVATQAHPEFRSRPMRVHPLFMEFVRSLVAEE
jgi:CTP synthase